MKAEISITSFMVIGAAIAVASLLAFAVINIAIGGMNSLSASATITEQNGVLIASIAVLRGSLDGVALMYNAPDGSRWYAKPLYCLGDTSLGVISARFPKPYGPGSVVTCAFQLWFPSRGEYGFTLLGISGKSVVRITNGILAAAQPNDYGGQMPAGNVYSSQVPLSLSPVGNSYNYTTIPIYWRGGYLAVEVEWGYNESTCLADGLYISLFVPKDAKTLVAPSDEGLRILPFGGADYVPAGSSLQIFVQFNPYDYGKEDGSIELAIMNSTGGVGAVVPTGFNSGKIWPAGSIWTTYVIYNASSDTLKVIWQVPGAFTVSYSYDLAAFGFSPPSAGQYDIAVGIANGGCAAAWRIYNAVIASS